MPKSTSLKVGDRVTLHSLNAVSMNGKKGELRKFLSEQNRWGVKVDGDPVLKTVKPENLKHQDTISVVVLPVEGNIFYPEVPASSRGELYHGCMQFLESGHSEFTSHRFKLPGNKTGTILMLHNMVFTDDMPINGHMAELGWGTYAEEIRGSIVLNFFYEDHTDPESETTTFFEAYDLETVKNLLREMAEIRSPGFPPTAYRVFVARELMKLEARPSIDIS